MESHRTQARVAGQGVGEGPSRVKENRDGSHSVRGGADTPTPVPPSGFAHPRLLGHASSSSCAGADAAATSGSGFSADSSGAVGRRQSRNSKYPCRFHVSSGNSPVPSADTELGAWSRCRGESAARGRGSEAWWREKHRRSGWPSRVRRGDGLAGWPASVLAEGLVFRGLGAHLELQIGEPLTHPSARELDGRGCPHLTGPVGD